MGIGKTITSFVNILEQAENTSADSESISQCLKQVIEDINLKL